MCPLNSPLPLFLADCWSLIGPNVHLDLGPADERKERQRESDSNKVSRLSWWSLIRFTVCMLTFLSDKIEKKCMFLKSSRMPRLISVIQVQNSVRSNSNFNLVSSKNHLQLLINLYYLCLIWQFNYQPASNFLVKYWRFEREKMETTKEKWKTRLSLPSLSLSTQIKIQNWSMWLPQLTSWLWLPKNC